MPEEPERIRNSDDEPACPEDTSAQGALLAGLVFVLGQTALRFLVLLAFAVVVAVIYVPLDSRGHGTLGLVLGMVAGSVVILGAFHLLRRRVRDGGNGSD